MIPAGCSVGELAFTLCESLKRLEIQEGVTEIEGGAFSNCYALSEVVWGAGVTEVHAGLFRYCSSLTSLTFPEGVEVLNMLAIAECENLREIHLPDTLKHIDWRVKDCKCPSLKAIYYHGTKQKWLKVENRLGYEGKNYPEVYLRISENPEEWECAW